MVKKFENISSIDDRETFDEANLYVDALINEATTNGSLAEQGANNEYTREIGRIACLCTDYESRYMKFNHLKFKSPLVVSIEKEMEKRHIKQRQKPNYLM